MNQQSEHRAQPEHDAQPDPAHPTATAPESVEHSVYEQAEHAGKQGPDANDPPEAAKKSGGDGAGVGPDPAPDLDGEPGSDLDPDESADVMETSEEAHRFKETRDDQREDGGIISLDPGD